MYGREELQKVLQSEGELKWNNRSFWPLVFRGELRDPTVDSVSFLWMWEASTLSAETELVSTGCAGKTEPEPSAGRRGGKGWRIKAAEAV